MRKSLFAVMVLALVAAFALPVIAAEAPADGLKMENTKMPVIFNHSSHSSYQCADCHHPVDGKENLAKCATAGCHDVFDKKDKSVHSYYKIIHDRKATTVATCMSCHLEAAGSDKDLKKELTGCKKSKCHP
ncbi:cytochrome c class III [Oleidesulfovibrio alaskensis G20]|jgi:cytochrome c553|uniref:Cytochrome c class III n=1 Tax=Oleidesulfovibrio alaskensis (strain ATCC BAA-1058 / DSM 17464 / G20) TaxID=207559 RepID=Q30WH0_OLEA2|nr:cytochrome c3 family protein [Oleidesulfovibrio alaskensis]2A3M_A Chain A, COG3005: Nitrate/TMAO reductases, membrane-bound tetraheme cytochrome c subunit [Oleidesulfovibrio alaskensis G20]2A3P_A Chain A, COG3005: Nitrate/TMAO reductases, membrane-bound tetraheme cytochrome c subunit [Oleidesulfovibrio alaskensis G20]ABB39976.1 cytochrome c class III [Oleidesulfovibrio alaskensis G20]MBG0774068.1 cytochrome c3 family protein [Oleidesulfovibrio alaskensis]MBL3581501.1 cytochrome c3 family pr